MPILSKGTDFITGQQVAASDLDNLVDAATFASGAVDNSTTQLSGGAIIVKDGGITAAKLESASNGQLFIGNGSGFTKATLTAGSNVTITNSSGGITIAAAGSGSVTSVQASGGSTGMSFSGGPVTSSGTLTLGGTLAVASGGTGSTTASGARTNLGLGTISTKNITVSTSAASGTPADGDVWLQYTP